MTPDEYRALRLALGLTQGGLAERLGVPREAIVRRERGKQRITEEAAIALRSFPRPPTKRVRKAPQKLCKLYGRMKCGDTMMAWDYVNDVALPEDVLRKDKARWAASERAKYGVLPNKVI